MAFTGNGQETRISLKVGSTAATTTSQYKTCYISAALTGSVVNTTTNYPIGIIDSYQSASSAVMQVIVHGPAKVYCAASVTAGDTVYSDGAGAVQTRTSAATTTTQDSDQLGWAMESGSTNSAITIFVNPVKY